MFFRKIEPKLFNGSVFLLGPRKVGKSTFLRQAFSEFLYIDLLDNALFSEYVNSPAKFYQFVKFQVDKDPSLRKLPIIVDEIQKVPLLLNDVYRLIEEDKVDFILCGSSARRLVRGGANMLGGRPV